MELLGHNVRDDPLLLEHELALLQEPHLFVQAQLALGGDMAQRAEAQRQLVGEVPGGDQGAVHDHVRDLAAHGEGVGVPVRQLLGAQGGEDLRLLGGELSVCGDAVHQPGRVPIVAEGQAQPQQVQSRGQSGTVEERHGDVDVVQVVGRLQLRHPLVVPPGQHQLRREGSGAVHRAHWVHPRNQEPELVVGVGQEDAVGDAAAEVDHEVIADVGDEHICVIQGLKPRLRRASVPVRRKRQLQPRQLHQVNGQPVGGVACAGVLRPR
mmetsp:Transcript_70148/g.123667  ORF Transcript_70148/g.123667 Transcript_70148/m.123667 type:complete len:266 (-) Transcript_70148:5499-6296(-)